MHSTINDRYKIYRYRYINIEKENTKHIQRNKKEKKTIHNISMAKRNQDIEQLKEFANEIASNEFSEHLPVNDFLKEKKTLEESSTSRRDFLKFRLWKDYNKDLPVSIWKRTITL